MNLTIKDIEVAKELNHEECAAVRGGSMFVIPTAQMASGGGFASPITQVSTPVAVDASTHLNLKNVTQNAVAIDSLLAQFGV